MKKTFISKPQSPGIYEIRNCVNEKVYVGQASRLNARAAQHEKSLMNGTHTNKHLQAAWNLYGPEAFEFTVLEVIAEKPLRDKAEQDLLDKLFGDCCYNILREVNPSKKVWSSTPEETRKKLSDKRKLWKHSEETKEKTRASMKGKNVGKVRSEEAKAKISAALKQRWTELKRIKSEQL